MAQAVAVKAEAQMVEAKAVVRAKAAASLLTGLVLMAVKVEAILVVMLAGTLVEKRAVKLAVKAEEKVALLDRRPLKASAKLSMRAKLF